jgi:ADP-ribose pyrophosphatase YjhB (NUDIX family)
MARSSRVITVSLPPELLNELNSLSKRSNLTRSQFLRQALGIYEHTADPKFIDANPESKDLAYLFQTYWNLKAKRQQDIQIVGLAIIHNKKNKVLIGHRENDEIVENLSWSFPGGKLESLKFDEQLVKLVHDGTGYTIQVRNLISARLFPDVTLSNTQIVALYFDCIIQSEKRSRIKENKFKELKWVTPMDVFKYFTSSTSDDVTKYLSTLTYDQ